MSNSTASQSTTSPDTTIPAAASPYNTGRLGRRALVGPLLAGIGVLHLAFTPIFQPAFLDLLRDRLLDGAPVASLAERVAQESGFWYVATGLGVLLVAGVSWWAERQGLRLPTAFGVALVLLSCCGLLLGPVTGFWLFVIPGVAVLVRQAQGRKVSPVSR